MKEHGFNGFMWVMTLGLLAYWGSAFVGHYFPRENSVEIQKVLLGTLQPGSKVEFPVIVTNNGFKEIALKPIMTSCGCLAPDREAPVVLLPGQNKLMFVFSAPETPGKIEQDILFLAETGTPSIWPTKIEGEVAASVWATPSKLTLQCDDPLSNPSETLVLHGADKNVKSITASPDTLQCSLVRKGNDQHIFSVTGNGELSREVLEKGKISGSLSFEFEGADQEYLVVTVDLVPKPKFTVSPISLEFQQNPSLRETLLEKIAVKKSADIAFENLTVVSVVPWARLVDTKEQGNYLFLTFEFLPQKMPQYESTVYARLTFLDLPDYTQVECKCLLK
jgi:hypothetical protein